MLAGAVLGPVGALAGAIGGAMAGSRAGAAASEGCPCSLVTRIDATPVGALCEPFVPFGSHYGRLVFIYRMSYMVYGSNVKSST